MGSRVHDAGVVVSMTAMTVVHRVVHKVSGGRLGRTLAGAPIVWLTVTGRRSGAEQQVPVVAAREGDHPDAPYLVAGSRGGTEKTPAWAWNLRGHAERGDTASLLDGDVTRTVDVTELTGAERDSGYARMVEAYRGFDGYQRQTDRPIPVFRLTPH